MFFVNRVYFYSKYIKQGLISSVLVFLFSYSFYSVGLPSAAQVTAKKTAIVAYKAVIAMKKADANYNAADATFNKTFIAFEKAVIVAKKADANYKTVVVNKTFITFEKAAADYKAAVVALKVAREVAIKAYAEAKETGAIANKAKEITDKEAATVK